jgi:hypothetical protein
MITAISAMDPTVAGILFLVAVVLFVVAAIIARPAFWACLVAAGLAFVSFVWMWDRFAAA